MKAWELLSDPAKWCKNNSAQDADGNYCYSDEDSACQWCMLGAINRCYPELEQNIICYQKVVNRLGLTHWLSIGDWNDAPERTHAEVLAVLKELDI